MEPVTRPTRRGFVATAAAALAAPAAAAKKIPAGIELYSVRDQLKQDLPGTVRAVAKMGYECVEFYSPYFDWKPDYAKDVRKLLDDLGVKCLSTHNSAKSFEPANIGHAIELNGILGSNMVVMASAGGRIEDLDGWKKTAERLSLGADKLKSAGMRAGFHNHQTEFKPIGGTRPMDVLAKNTPHEVVLQLDVGTCIDAGSDPVAWIRQNPGRIRSMHCKDWAPVDTTKHPDKGYKVLFGEGVAPWKKIFQAAEKAGGIEFYLIEQEGSRFDPFDTAKRCLDAYRKMRK